MIISITELELKSFWNLFKTIQLSSQCIKYCKNDNDNIDVQVNSKGWRYHRTLTVWKDLDSMKKFVRSDVHSIAMKYTPKLSKNVRVVHYESDTIPSWKEAIERLEKIVN